MNENPINDHDVRISLGKTDQESQITTKDTGWTEEEKDRMRQAGYDGMDMIRAWYS